MPAQIPTTTPYTIEIMVTDTGTQNNQQASTTISVSIDEDQQTNPELTLVQVRHEGAADQISLSSQEQYLKVDFKFNQSLVPGLYNVIQNANVDDTSVILGLNPQSDLQIVGNCSPFSAPLYEGPRDQTPNDSNNDLHATALFETMFIYPILNGLNLGVGDTITIRFKIRITYEQQAYFFTAKKSGITIVQ
jgi:hypothetical protein